MLVLVLSALTALQVATPVPASLTAAPVAVVAPAPATPAPSDEYLARARKAFDAGDFGAARRDYVIAAALDRDEGRLPVLASFGLSRVLFAQFNSKEAAHVLWALARDANEKGDDNTEARALAEGIWLSRESNPRVDVRNEATRLMTLMRGNTLSAETRRVLRETTTF